jgi:2-amino-4-hydroxy-6-hydroxymethyldihydropteridine diphosphokinase
MSMCFLGLGSNLGDRLENLKAAVMLLAQNNLPAIRISSVYETSPVGSSDVQENYLNAVVAVESDLEPHALVDTVLALERQLGRTRSVPNAPRNIDIDVLLAGDTVCADANACIPHPRLHQRLFVLIPLREIAAETRVPGTGRSVDELYLVCRMRSDETVRLFAPAAMLKY